jgi:hypothetical protein
MLSYWHAQSLEMPQGASVIEQEWFRRCKADIQPCASATDGPTLKLEHRTRMRGINELICKLVRLQIFIASPRFQSSMAST